jgi:hypothetical protein
MDGNTTLRVLFGLGMGAAACLVVVNGHTPPTPLAFEVQGPPGPDGTVSQAQPSGDGVSLFTAVQEQLELKLDAQRGPVDVLVIDSAQRPVED